MITVGPDENAMWQRRFPLVMIRPGSSTADPTADEDPRLIQQNISIQGYFKWQGASTDRRDCFRFA